MERHITASEANRQFSRILREVREGTSYIITSHGKPVARLAPPESDIQLLRDRKDAYLAELRQQPARGIPLWNRSELYDHVAGGDPEDSDN